MRGKRGVLLLAALVLLFFAMPVSPAHACTCATRGDPREGLAAADGAFIGKLVSRRETGPLDSIISTGRDVIYTFEVAEAVKGDLGRRVEVHSAAAGMSCGFEVPPGEPIGVLLEGGNGTWRSGLCGQIDPGELRTAAAPLPAPDGHPPAALVVGGGFGEARLLALDRQARTLAYGYGAGDTTQLSVCPDGHRILELVRDHPKPSRLALRELPDLRLVWERPLPPQPSSVYADSLRCLSGDGSAYVFASNGGDPRWSPSATLLRVSPTTTTVLYRGTARSIAFGPNAAYVNEGRWGEQIGRINLRSGQLTPVLTGPRYMTRLALRPDGLALATQVWGDDLVQQPGQNNRSPRPPQAAVINLQPSPPRIRTTILGPADQTETGKQVWGNMVWLTSDRVGFFPADGAVPRAVIFDSSLRELGGIDQWAASTTLLAGDGIIGLGQGKLSVAELPNGPARVLQQFQSPQTFALAALSGATQVLPQAPATQVPVPGAAPVPRAAEPETPEDATLPIPLLAAATATLVLLTGLVLFGRARRRRTPDA